MQHLTFAWDSCDPTVMTANNKESVVLLDVLGHSETSEAESKWYCSWVVIALLDAQKKWILLSFLEQQTTSIFKNIILVNYLCAMSQMHLYREMRCPVWELRSTTQSLCSSYKKVVLGLISNGSFISRCFALSFVFIFFCCCFFFHSALITRFISFPNCKSVL